jgi:hypothetical protein
MDENQDTTKSAVTQADAAVTMPSSGISTTAMPDNVADAFVQSQNQPQAGVFAQPEVDPVPVVTHDTLIDRIEGKLAMFEHAAVAEIKDLVKELRDLLSK